MTALWAPHTVGGRPRCGVDTGTGTCVGTGAQKMSRPLAFHRTPDLEAKSQENDWDRNDLMKENCLIFIEFPRIYGSCTHKGFLFIWKFWWTNKYLIGDCFVGSTHCWRQATVWRRHRGWHMRGHWRTKNFPPPGFLQDSRFRREKSRKCVEIQERGDLIIHKIVVLWRFQGVAMI